MVKTSLVCLNEAISNGQALSKGDKISLPLVGNAEIYGFIIIENEFLSDELSSKVIDMPPLGQASVLSNRVIFSFDNHLFRFPIFNSVGSADEERYKLLYLYIPRFLNQKDQWSVEHYRQSMKNEVPHPKVERLGNVRIENNVAYYFPTKEDLYFTSTSKLRGIGRSFVVISRRISQLTGDIKYEIFNPDEVMIEKL